MRETKHRFLPTLNTALSFLLLLAMVAQPAEAAPPAPPPPMVGVARIAEQDVTPVTEYVGHVEAIQAVDLRARVEGFLEQVNFTEGDYVRAGDVLYVIEQAPYQAQVDAARAVLQQAQAELVRADQHLTRLLEANSESISAIDLDNARAAELTAKAQVAAAEAALTGLSLDLAYTTIKAPISGRIGRTAYTRGNLVGPSSEPLARIVQTDPVRVVYSISENDLSAVTAALHDAQKQKQRLLAPRIRLTGGDLFPATGQVAFVDNEVDQATGTIAVRANFVNPAGALIPGQYVTVLVQSAEPRMQPLVPQAAVLVNRDGRSVLVVDKENRVSNRPIVIGSAYGTMWAVETGLAVGEQVIVQGIQKVKPGQTVQIQAAPQQEK